MTAQKVKSIVFRSGMMILRIIPIPLVFLRWTIRFCHAVISGKQPQNVMKYLLQVEDDLNTMINIAAIQYDNGVHVKHRLIRYHDFFVERIRPGEKVLDIGCGNGVLAYDIALKSQAVITGIDIEAKHIAIAKQKFGHHNLAFVLGDAVTCLQKKKVDVIVLSNVLEHINDRNAFLNTILAKSSPERLLIRVPMVNRYWTVPLRKELGLPYFSDDSHFTEYTMDSFMEEMEMSGLHIVYCQVNWGEIWAEVRPK
jgi:SAM-dependent methyltransferase